MMLFSIRLIYICTLPDLAIGVIKKTPLACSSDCGIITEQSTLLVFSSYTKSYVLITLVFQNNPTRCVRRNVFTTGG